MSSGEAWKLCAALCGALAVADAQGACKIAQIAEWHVTREYNRPFVDGVINDQPVRILLDTGSFASFISGGAARRLKLRIREEGGMASGVNGEVREQIAVVDHLKVAGFSADDLRLRVTASKMGEDPHGVGFVLGADFFRHFATEFDLAHDTVRLLKPKDCKPDQMPYWDSAYFQIEIERPSGDWAAFIGPILINGVRLRAQFDTGSELSFITTPAARRAGVTVTDPGVKPADPVTGIAEVPLPTWIGRFDTVTIGDETARNARLRIGDLFGADRSLTTGSHIAQVDANIIDVIVGDDFFQAHRAVVLPDDHLIVFTYNGGPVFQVVRPDAAPTQSATGASNEERSASD